MAWLWETWEEYVDAVHPSAAARPGTWRLSRKQSWIEVQSTLWETVRKLTEAHESLWSLEFSGKDHQRPPSDSSTVDKAKQLVLSAIYSGEKLFLYHKRLAKSDAAYGFLHQNDLLEHWERYNQTERISSEIDQLVKDISELLQGFHALVQADDRFIIGNLDLPSSLESDFRLARNLFSVGFDEVGVLMAGRGLEGVLRKIAETRKIILEVKGKPFPASEANTNDLIEAMFQIRWKTKKARLITDETRALLHYLRTIRNGRAHAPTHGSQASNSRETAIVIAEIANKLWKEATSRAHITPLTVQKTW
jgi:hypothetical protein